MSQQFIFTNVVVFLFHGATWLGFSYFAALVFFGDFFFSLFIFLFCFHCLFSFLFLFSFFSFNFPFYVTFILKIVDLV